MVANAEAPGPPGPLSRVVHSDSLPPHDPSRRNRLPAFDEKGTFGAEVDPVEGQVDPQRPRQTTRSAGESYEASLTRFVRGRTLLGGATGRPTLDHPFRSEPRGERADQDGGGLSDRTRHDVQAVVHPIDKIDVGTARLPEHHLRAGGEPARGMTRSVVWTIVGLDLDDRPLEASAALQSANQPHPEKITGHLENGPSIEAAGRHHRFDCPTSLMNR